MAGILAATISSSDSYLLIAASAFAKNIFQGVCNKKATDKQVMLVTRVTLLIIAIIAIIIALDENSVIFKIVSFAWAGFGAAFGPVILCALFWRRSNKWGALAGMVSGTAMVFIWKYAVRPAAAAGKLPAALDIYELLPAFIIAFILIVVVSLVTGAPDEEVTAVYDDVKSTCKAK